MNIKTLTVILLYTIAIISAWSDEKVLWDFENGKNSWKAAGKGCIVETAGSGAAKIGGGALKLVFSSDKCSATVNFKDQAVLKGKSYLSVWLRASAPCNVTFILKAAGKDWKTTHAIPDTYWHEYVLSLGEFQGSDMRKNILSANAAGTVNSLSIRLDKMKNGETTLLADHFQTGGRILNQPGVFSPDADDVLFATDFANKFTAKSPDGEVKAYFKKDSAVKQEAYTFTDSFSGKALKAVSGAGKDQLNYPVKGHILAKSGTIEFWFKPSWNGFDPGMKKPRASFIFLSGRKDFKTLIYFYRLNKGSTFNFCVIESKQKSNIISVSTTRWKKEQWHHVSVTWGEDGRRIYIDGILRRQVAAESEGISLTNKFYLANSVGENQPDGTIANFLIRKFAHKKFPVYLPEKK